MAGSIYGATLILLYTMSSIYHGLKFEVKAKKVFQVIDHCAIFLLIAGSYTPIALCTLRQYDATIGWLIFGLTWALATVGIILNAIDLKKFKIFSMICYLVMGWCIIFKINLLPMLLGKNGLILLITGGIAYTVGAVLYVIGRKRKWAHSIFHILCVLGSLLHFFCILFYVI